MARFETAVEAWRAGQPVMVYDEDRPDRAALARPAESAPRLAAAGPIADRGAAGLFGAVDRVAAESEAGAAEARPAIVTVPGGVLARPALAEALADLLVAAAAYDVALVEPADRAPVVEALPTGSQSADGAPASVSVQDVVRHRLDRETIVEQAAVARLPSLYAGADFKVHAWRGLLDGCEHLAMVHAPRAGAGPSPVPLVRVHSECLTGDALGSLRCDCGDQLRRALALMADEPAGGILVYLRGHEGRGIGLANKIRAYALQDEGLDTVEANESLGFAADLRDYAVAVQILARLGARRVRLLSNNPRKGKALARYGIEVVERLPLRIGANPHNALYLDTKRRKLGHDLVR